jgi:hypothetical protein
MAYMSQDKKKQIEPTVKTILKKYGLKGSLSVKNYSTLVLTIRAGKVDFLSSYKYRHDGDTYIPVNEYCINSSFDGVSRAVLLELKQAMSQGNYNRSDLMTDYHDVGFYISIRIGAWDKPYQLIK